MILADENIDHRVIVALRKGGIQVLSVRESYQGISDAEVIELSKNPYRLILTEDKDFGEWVYAHNERTISVILLRYHISETQQIIDLLLSLILDKGERLFGKFTIIGTQKIRIRTIK